MSGTQVVGGVAFLFLPHSAHSSVTSCSRTTRDGDCSICCRGQSSSGLALRDQRLHQPGCEKQNHRRIAESDYGDSNQRPSGYELLSETANLLPPGLTFKASLMILSSSQPYRTRLRALHPRLFSMTKDLQELVSPLPPIYNGRRAKLSLP